MHKPCDAASIEGQAEEAGAPIFERTAMHIWILVLVFMTPTGQLGVAFDKEHHASRAECNTAAEHRAASGRKQVLWLSASCVEAPASPEAIGAPQ